MLADALDHVGAGRGKMKDGAAAVGIAHLNSLRRYDPDQVRWVGQPALSSGRDFAGLGRRVPEAPMVPFFVQIKCQLGKSYEVANKLADAEIASEIYSTAGDFDLLVKFYVDAGTDIGHFVNERVQTIPGIQDTHTIITFKAFS
jgi:DNA-binding Lrp family transcriptional regulator